jgi:hypothetical protein
VMSALVFTREKHALKLARRNPAALRTAGQFSTTEISAA